VFARDRQSQSAPRRSGPWALSASPIGYRPGRGSAWRRRT